MAFDLKKELATLAEEVGVVAFHTICKIAANGFPRRGGLESAEWVSDELDRELTGDEAKVAAHLALLIEEKAKELSQTIYSKSKRSAADGLHNKPGGSREKADQIRNLWASGKYSSRAICAEEECAAIGLSFDTARRHLRGTPDPDPWPGKG